MWVPPSTDNLAPSYAERDVGGELANGDLIVVASGLERDRGTTALRIGNDDAALHVARLGGGQSIDVPSSPFGHVFLARGSANFDDVGPIEQGDVVRLTDSGRRTITAATACEILIWEMHAAAG